MKKVDSLLHDLRSSLPRYVTFTDAEGEKWLEYLQFLVYYCMNTARGVPLTVKDAPGLIAQLEAFPSSYKGTLLREILTELKGCDAHDPPS